MIFSSIEFLVFFLIVLLLIAIVDSPFLCRVVSRNMQRKAERIVLLVASYLFYGWWDWRFCFLMLFMTFLAWYSARQFERKISSSFFRILGIVVPLVTLGVFKYSNFFLDSFCRVFSISLNHTLSIILPVGISFYTFQSLSYTIDVCRGTLKSQSFLDVAVYISFFPQLVAGPIVKAADFIPQLHRRPDRNFKKLLNGIQIFCFGLFKKIVIADNLSVFVDDVFSRPGIFSSASVILAVISYSIQIYMDFSGYSDMAIGSALCLGYEFKPNFNLPYISTNVTVFWKRWHISLSSWLQEYLYIPLGGNRTGTFRTYINLMITMVLGGLWHGANVTFIIWGALHGIALCLHKAFKKSSLIPKSDSVFVKAFSTVITYCFVCLCWVFFRADSLSSAFLVLQKIFFWQDGVVQIFSWSVFAIILLFLCEIVAWLRSHCLGEKQINGFYWILDLTNFWQLTAFFVFVGLIIALAYTGANPFIYFQF